MTTTYDLQEREEAQEVLHSRQALACTALLKLLCEHHPEYCPIELRPKPIPPPVEIKIERKSFEPPALVRTTGIVPMDNEYEGVSIQDIQRVVCKAYGMSKLDLITHRRSWPQVKLRQVSYYLCRELTTKSFPEIGRRHGGRDHSTVIHGASKIAAQIPIDAMLASEIASLKAALGAK